MIVLSPSKPLFTLRTAAAFETHSGHAFSFLSRSAEDVRLESYAEIGKSAVQSEFAGHL